MVSNCFNYLITHQSPFNLKTVFLRVLSRVKQTIASIKLLIGICKQSRRTVDNQSRSVLQPFYYVSKLFIGIDKQGRQTDDNQSWSVLQLFYYVLIKTMALMTLAKSTNVPSVTSMTRVWIAICGLSS